MRTNEAITGAFAWFPESISFANYVTILTDPSWYDGYINSITYVVINTVLSVSIALPAAYAFSRYSFLGDKHLFFWLLTNRMTPPAVFLLPFFQLYSALGLMDTHIAVALAHEAERLGAALLDRASRAVDVEADLAAEEVVRVQSPEHDVRVGHGRLGPAPPVAGRPGNRARAPRANGHRSECVDRDDAPRV